jgi:hypothetical protein
LRKGIARTFKWHKSLGGILHLKPTAGCQISTLIFGIRGRAINIPTIFQGIFIGSPTKSKYQRWYLTPCCGLEVHNPTHAIKSVKGPRNTFDLNPKWSRTLPSLIYFSWDIYRDLQYQLWYLKKNIMEGGLYKYSMKNILRTAKFLPTWSFNQRYFLGL